MILTLKQSNTPHTTDCPILINFYRYIYICIFHHITIMFLIVLRYIIIIIFIIIATINTLYRVFHSYSVAILSRNFKSMRRCLVTEKKKTYGDVYFSHNFLNSTTK